MEFIFSIIFPVDDQHMCTGIQLMYLVAAMDNFVKQSHIVYQNILTWNKGFFSTCLLQ